MKNLIMLFLAIEAGIVAMGVFKYAFPPADALNQPEIESAQNLLNLSNPPSQSLTAHITTSAGEINFQSRDATEPAKINKLTQIRQGEKVRTGPTGTLTAEFRNTASITVSGNSELSFVQTLPQNLVFNQTIGTVLYTTQGTSPLSVRALHLLADQTKGEMSVTVDSDLGQVIVKANKGEISLGYNDKDLNSQTLTLVEGKEVVFDDDTRTVIVNKIKSNPDL